MMTIGLLKNKTCTLGKDMPTSRGFWAMKKYTGNFPVFVIMNKKSRTVNLIIAERMDYGRR